MLQDSPHNKQFYVGDDVRIKLSAFREPRWFATQILKRDKDDGVNAKKYSAITYSITVYRISRMHHHLDVEDKEALALIQQNRPNRHMLINPMRDTYELETQAGDRVMRTVNRRANNAFLGPIAQQQYVPELFFGSDLLFVPPNTTAPSVPENTNRIMQINRFPAHP